MGIVIAILAFGIMILTHEWGHFIVARKCGVTVEEFAIGMGPRLLSHRSKKSGTVYSLRLFPLGGFCQMKGESGSSMESTLTPQEKKKEEKTTEEAENVQLPEETKAADLPVDAAADGTENTAVITPSVPVMEEDAFYAKSVWKRLAIVIAGPVMNLVTALVLGFILVMCYGYNSAVVTELNPDYHAAEDGIEQGDTILRIGKRSIHIMQDVSYALLDVTEEPVEVEVQHSSGEKEVLTVRPVYDEAQGLYRLGVTISSYHSGVSGTLEEKGIGALPELILRSCEQSYWTMVGDVEIVVRSFVQLITGKVALNNLMGPIGIVSVMDQVYSSSAQTSFWDGLGNIASIMVLLSVNLGVVNMFPFPGLDGSRVVFLILEKIRGKKVSEKLENIVYLIGFILLLLLMVLIAAQDIVRLVQ